jgi:hypothetical protein
MRKSNRVAGRETHELEQFRDAPGAFVAAGRQSMNFQRGEQQLLDRHARIGS